MIEMRTKAPFTKAKSTQLQTWPNTRLDTELRLSVSDGDMGVPVQREKTLSKKGRLAHL